MNVKDTLVRMQFSFFVVGGVVASVYIFARLVLTLVMPFELVPYVVWIPPQSS